jgi:hypothetical protein
MNVLQHLQLILNAKPNEQSTATTSQQTPHRYSRSMDMSKDKDPTNIDDVQLNEAGLDEAELDEVIGGQAVLSLQRLSVSDKFAAPDGCCSQISGCLSQQSSV